MYQKFNKMNKNDNVHEEMVQCDDYTPFVWLSCVSMRTWLKAGMHHIFHGAVARIMLVMEKVFTAEDKNSTFEDVVNPYLLEMQALRLDWLYMKSLPKTNWLAEDELGFSRISSFVYGLFFLNVPLDESSTISRGCLLSIRQMISALMVMVSLLMSPRDPVIILIDRHIKIFCHAVNDSVSCISKLVKHHSGRTLVTFHRS